MDIADSGLEINDSATPDSVEGTATEEEVPSVDDAAVKDDRFTTGEPGAVRVEVEEATAHDLLVEAEVEVVGRTYAPPGGGQAFPLEDDVDATVADVVG